MFPIVLTRDDVERLLPVLPRYIKQESAGGQGAEGRSRMPMKFNFHLPLYMVGETAVESVVVAGHGADEIFGGYDRYRRMTEEDFLASTRRDAVSLLSGDLEDARNMLASVGKTLFTPYMSPGIMEWGLSLSREERMGSGGCGENKRPLRMLARELGLEEGRREKKAAQFGCGSARLLREVARMRGVTEEELFNP